MKNVYALALAFFVSSASLSGQELGRTTPALSAPAGGGTDFTLYVTSQQMGQPGTIERDYAAAAPIDLANNARVAMTYDANGHPATATFTDSVTGAIYGRIDYAFRADGKMTRYVTNVDSAGSGHLVPLYEETYRYDALDSVAAHETFYYDLTGAVNTGVGHHYTRTYDAANRPVRIIDSAYDFGSGAYVLTAAKHFAYAPGTAEPFSITFSDTSGRALRLSRRYSRIVWANYARGWMDSAVVEGRSGATLATIGRYDGSGTALEHTHTLLLGSSLRPTDPPTPFFRSTKGYNTQGDLVASTTEFPDSNSATGWVYYTENYYLHEYNLAGNKLSQMVWLSYDSNDQLYPFMRFLYEGLTATRNLSAGVSLHLAPNPARQSVRIVGAPYTEGLLLSPEGRAARRFALGMDGSAQLSLQGLAPGVYHVQMAAGVAGRLVVE